MKEYKDKITLARNGRGCYILDTIKGCSICKKEKPLGCYDDCYAKNISSRYGFNFSIPIKRKFLEDSEQLYMFDFANIEHENEIINQVSKIEMPFVRIGEMGDPSISWTHTFDVCKVIALAKKPIVIITKHWEIIPQDILVGMGNMGICINTSISALDSPDEIGHRLIQYKRIKKYCNSILRIVSCDFNESNEKGKYMAKIQKALFNNTKTIDTIFRPRKSNKLVLEKVINISRVKFLSTEVLASVYNKNTYFGHCKNCPDMCGIKGNK